MDVDVVHHRGLDPRVGEGGPHHADGPVAVLAGGGDVVGVPRHAVAHDLAEDPGTPVAGVLQLLQDEDPRPLADDESVPVTVKGS